MLRRYRVVLWALCAAYGAFGADGDAVAELSTFDNAAYDYWKAAALIQEILNEGEFDAILFAEQELPSLPPKAFAYHPVAGKWLLNDRMMLEHLHQGAAKTHCVFVREGEATARDVELYRGAARRIVLRSLACAKAFEFVGNHRATGAIYADLLRLLRHMDEGGDWAAVDFTLGHLPLVLKDIEGFLTRHPPRESVEMITKELAAARPRFPIVPMLERDAQAHADWLLADPAKIEAKIAGLYGDTIVKPALNELLQMSPDEDAEQVQAWIDGYRAEVRRLGAALSRPYPEAIQLIRAMDAKLDGIGPHASMSPLVPLLMLPTAPLYERYVSAEAHLAMVEVLCLGAIHWDFVGEWPDTLAALAQFAGEKLPVDPFTGQEFIYDLRGKLPRIQNDAPNSVEELGAVTDINLRLRIEADEEALASMIRAQQRRQLMEEATSTVPSKTSGEASGTTPPRRRPPSRTKKR